MSAKEAPKLPEQPVYITAVAKREPIFRGGVTYELPLSFDSDVRDWLKSIGAKPQVTFAKGSMRELDPIIYKIWQAMKAMDETQLRTAMGEAKPWLGKSHEEKTDLEKWSDAAVQLPGDWGFHGRENRKKAQEMITAMANGTVLEAMCGFNSYFSNAPHIKEVVALDFCREALERYSHPKRKRILFDMERLCQGEQIPFFRNGSFNTVGAFFGMDYMSDATRVYEEFRRILTPGGEVLIVGGTTQGYGDLIRQYFKPNHHLKLMTEAGFRAEVIPMPFKTQWEIGDYYMVAGKKPS